jgi:hypothetical protein
MDKLTECIANLKLSDNLTSDSIQVKLTVCTNLKLLDNLMQLLIAYTRVN